MQNTDMQARYSDTENENKSLRRKRRKKRQRRKPREVPSAHLPARLSPHGSSASPEVVLELPFAFMSDIWVCTFDSVGQGCFDYL